MGRPYFTDDVSRHCIPTVMSFYLAPSIGWAEMGSDPINVAAQQLYSDIRHKQTGAKNYDASDLMIYCVAMANVYAYINYLQRVYQTSLLFSQENASFPRLLLKSMGVDPDDLHARQADFRYGVNSLIRKAASTSVPATLNYFRRVAFLYTSVYTEGSSIKDQLYLFNPMGFYKYQLDNNSRGMLKYVDFMRLSIYPSNLRKVDDLLSFGNDLLSNVYTSEDAGTMSGDILNAYGEANIIKLQTLPEESPLPLGFNITVLEQMKNCDYFSSAEFSVDEGSLDVVQVSTSEYNAELRHKPSFSITKNGWPNLPNVLSGLINKVFTRPEIITTTTANPGPQITMENTRLKAAKYKLDESSLYVHPMTEIVMDVKIWNVDESHIPTGTLPKLIAVSVTTGESPNYERWLRDASRFDFAPYLLEVESNTAEDVLEYVDVHGDIDNYTIASQDDLNRLNEAALLNLFHVNSIGRV